jgi:hypothetical protein
MFTDKIILKNIIISENKSDYAKEIKYTLD